MLLLILATIGLLRVDVFGSPMVTVSTLIMAFDRMIPVHRVFSCVPCTIA